MPNGLTEHIVAFYALQSVTGWNRLEPRPRAEHFDRSLKAEVRDPLWMLARQWQFGEFKGDDAGSPVWARMKMRTTRINRFTVKDGEVKELNYTVEDLDPGEQFSPPLETMVEREVPKIDLLLSLQMGRYWLKVLDSRGLSAYRAAFVSQYPFVLPTQDEDHTEIYAHTSVWQLMAAAAGRSMNGEAFYEHLETGGDATDGIGAAPADQDKIKKAAEDFVQWFQDQYNIPGDGEDAWAPPYLEYQFKVSAPEDATGTAQTVLTADQYYHGHLDWYSFNIDHDTSALTESGISINDAIQKQEVKNFIPAQLEFPGMPNPRWWEFEDRRTHFGAIDANTTDTAKLLLVEFGLIWANDWFMLPYDLDAGTLATVEGLAVTDNFGFRFWIPAAGSGMEKNWQRWSMYHLNHGQETLASDTRLFLPPAAGKIMESPVLESVNFIRDEMANMVWGIETRIPLEDGSSKRGFEASDELLKYLDRVLPKSTAPGTLTPTDAKIAYLLQTRVPENWIPFIPVKVPLSDREIQLQRSRMLRVIEDVAATPSILPRTELLQVGIKESKPYFIHEEEVPRAGVIVSRTWQRARWYNGKVYTWIGRRKQTGRGEGVSNLRFDQIIPKNE